MTESTGKMFLVAFAPMLFASAAWALFNGYTLPQLAYQAFANRPAYGCTDQSAIMLAETVSTSKWRFEEYGAFNDSGIEIWHANEAYGLGVGAGSDTYVGPGDGNLSDECRELVYAALKPHKDAWFEGERLRLVAGSAQ